MPENTLSQNEVDALLDGVSGSVEAEKFQGEIRSFNLAEQQYIGRGRLPTLELINERFTRLLRIGLFNFLRRSSEVSTGAIKVTEYAEFLKTLAQPTNINLIQIKPLRGTALIVIDPDLIFLFVDNFFGGDGRFQVKGTGREFTPTEQRTIQRVLNIIFESYTKAWEPVYKIAMSFIRSEINTQFANIAGPTELVAVTTFRIDIGSIGGLINFCFPYSMIEPIRDLLANDLQGQSDNPDHAWEILLKKQLQSAEVEVVADLCKIPSTLKGILNLKVGDIVPVTLPPSIELKVNGVPIIRGSFGQHEEQYAFRVEELIKSNKE
jgi:flagellar motor switch protein FliM